MDNQKNIKPISEALKTYASNFFQALSMFLVVWVALAFVITNQPDEPSQKADFLTSYLMIGSFCILFACHKVAEDFYRSDRFEEYAKLKQLPREEYLKLRDFLHFIKK